MATLHRIDALLGPEDPDRRAQPPSDAEALDAYSRRTSSSRSTARRSRTPTISNA